MVQPWLPFAMITALICELCHCPPRHHMRKMLVFFLNSRCLVPSQTLEKIYPKECCWATRLCALWHHKYLSHVFCSHCAGASRSGWGGGGTKRSQKEAYLDSSWFILKYKWQCIFCETFWGLLLEAAITGFYENKPACSKKKVEYIRIFKKSVFFAR